jgi:hypothetical protein
MLTEGLSSSLLVADSYKWWKREHKDLVKNMDCWLHSNVVPYVTKGMLVI